MPKNKYKMLIITSWVVLIICFIIKIIGLKNFDFQSDNSKFIRFCNYVDNILWLKMIIACIVCVLTTYPIICVLINKKYLNIKSSLIYIPLMIASSIISWYSTIINMIIQGIYLIIIPLIQTKGKFKRIILTIIFVSLFQIISLLIRNINITNFNDNNCMISLMFQIDYYIMILLLYLYNFKERKEV